MLINQSAMVLNLLSVAVMTLLVATALQALTLLPAARFLARLSPDAQKKALWLFVTTPWGVSIVCVLVCLPSLLRLERPFWLDPLVHWHHPFAFQLNSWHGATMLVFFLGVGYLISRKWADSVRHLNSLNTLRQLSQARATRQWNLDQDVVVLESPTPLAFTAGLRSPKCYVTTGLIQRISETELDIIIDHERAHITHKDTQKKLLFAMLAALYPRPVARRLNQLFSLASELLADARVSHSYCKFDIAQTLISAARVQRLFTGNTNAGLVNYFVAEDVDYRVRALVQPQELMPFPWTFSLLAMVSITILSSIGVDGLHHLLETGLSH
ncbi:MAG: M56 family metallopeptidase [Immundisolibacteraceae bacterium]|nr:M56 family metallopeptidase [Immundisolibacteraceae bacterium]